MADYIPSVREQYAKGDLVPDSPSNAGGFDCAAMFGPGAEQFQKENPEQVARLQAYSEAHKQTSTAESLPPAEQKKKRAAKCPSTLRGRPYPLWRVEQLLPMTGLAALVGKSGAGKSFLAIELAAALATGQDFFGLSCEKSKVLYIVLEGAGDFQQRLAAWEYKWGKEFPCSPAFSYDDDPLNIFEKEEQEALLEEVPEGGVIFIDTMAQATAGMMDENSSKDMGQLIAACNRIVHEKQCLIILVAHMGKDEERGLRGHSSLRCALDAQIDVTRVGNSDVRAWRLSKSKASEDGRKAGFNLVPVRVGENAKRQGVFSCYVQTTELPTAGKPSSGLGGTVSTATLKTAQDAFISALQGSSSDFISWTAWVDAFHPLYKATSTRDSVERTLRNARKVMLESGQVEDCGRSIYRKVSDFPDSPSC